MGFSLEGDLNPKTIVRGCIVFKWIERKNKDGKMKKYGPYAYHVTKKPPDFHSKQAWDYIGKVGSKKYNDAIRYLQNHQLLPGSNNTVREMPESRLKGSWT
jgi:hypothetical protein